jgi:precorrin-2 dehydrogenase/sirohydrochlorin ferrochelatase
MNSLFSVFLKLEELHTLKIGGGIIRVEKISAVIANSPNAKITLVAPEIRSEIVTLVRGKQNIQVV